MSRNTVKSVKLMLVLKLIAVLAVAGIAFFTPLAATIVTVVVACVVSRAAVSCTKPGFDRAFLMLIGCALQGIVLAILPGFPLLQTGLMYAGLVFVFGVPLDSLEGVFQAFGYARRRSHAVQTYRRSGPEVVDAEVIDD